MFWENEDREKSSFGIVFNIEHYHINDGEGIRTNVFLKYCNLWCQWCCNPESQALEPQVAVFSNICKQCYICEDVCPEKAVSHDEQGDVVIDTKLCKRCAKCIEKCPYDARELYGKRMNVADVMVEVERESQYYITSGGGMTLSGGEPCMQPDFARELLQACKRRYIDTAIETAAALPWEKFWYVAQNADTILFDLKYTNEEKFATISNEPYSSVKENAINLIKNNKHVVLRCPIITSKNDDDKHVEGIIEFAQQSGIVDVDILPFHQLGRFKYKSLGMEYQLDDLQEMKKEEMQKIQEKLQNSGLNASIGG